jgi:HEAT repeat protein
MDLLPKLGPRAAALVPDLLAYVGRQESFTNESPHLIHLDPQGRKAIPGLIALLSDPKETVRNQAASELAAYGPLAGSAIPILTELAVRLKGIDLVSIEAALAAIQMGAPAKSPTQVAFEQLKKAAQE